MSDRLPASSVPTLRQLQFLAALQTHGGFVRAAEAVGVTQPTLSAGIKELESALGAVLVERGRNGALLTPAGEEAAARAADMLEGVEELVRAVRGASAPLSGGFRLGAIPTVAPFLLPQVLPVLKKRHPSLRLSIKEDQTARLVEALQARALDAAIIALPYEAPGIETEVFLADEFFLACPANHPLASRNDLAPEHVAKEELLLLDDGHCLRDHALSVCRAPPSRKAADVGATSLYTLVHLVGAGMGVTLVPKIAADHGAIEGAKVAVRPFAQPIVGRELAVAWRRDGARAEEARMLAQLMREVVGS